MPGPARVPTNAHHLHSITFLLEERDEQLSHGPIQDLTGRPRHHVMTDTPDPWKAGDPCSTPRHHTTTHTGAFLPLPSSQAAKPLLWPSLLLLPPPAEARPPAGLPQVPRARQAGGSPGSLAGMSEEARGVKIQRRTRLPNSYLHLLITTPRTRGEILYLRGRWSSGLQQLVFPPSLRRDGKHSNSHPPPFPGTVCVISRCSF